MAKLMRNLRKTHERLSNSNLFNATKQNPSLFTSKLHPGSRITTRNLRFEDNVSRLIRREIQYELERFPSKQLATKFNSFTVDEQPGEQGWLLIPNPLNFNKLPIINL
ncbi:hypothetical protein Ddye_019955 [Dipteronia dyeriana]|uniref:Uncharacterized protein n=1 Tax=Dipteronia dyeriana TaxID=168575 RepID=A0AAD9WWL1_9ROSI|nr:hypothetical protein Ddye_019955 [Dipteronia dyeriana]